MRARARDDSCRNERKSPFGRTVSCGYETYARFRSTYCGDGGHTCERRNSPSLPLRLACVRVFNHLPGIVTNRGHVIFSSPLFRSYGGKPPVDGIHTYADKNRKKNNRRKTDDRNADDVTPPAWPSDEPQKGGSGVTPFPILDFR